ncbi:MAG: AAA family ATPase [Thalassovita sp.]
MNAAGGLKGTFSTEAEQLLLGAILCVNERYHDVASFVRADHFYEPTHADIWRCLAGRIEKDHLADVVMLKADLISHEGLSQLGGAGYLARLAGASMGGSQLVDYAQMIVELYNRRELLGRFRQIGGEVEAGRSSSDAASELELFLHEREETSTEPRTMSMLKAQTNALMQMQEIAQGGNIGIPTGLASLDEVLTLAPKRYTILAGATSMGKTALGIWLSYAAAKAGYGVGFVTLEMPEEDLAKRTNSIVSQVPYKAYDKPMSETLFLKTKDAAEALQELPVQIFSDRVRDVPAILSEGKKLKRKMPENQQFKGFKLLVIDYLQLVRGRGESHFVQLSQIANDLKQVAKQLDVHVVALAQVDRKIGERDDTRPRLSDLRGSGDLENAPDNVVFIHRPEYYLSRQPEPVKADDRADWLAELEHSKNSAEIIIAKARMGEICTVKVGCDMGTNRFWDLDHTAEMDF